MTDGRVVVITGGASGIGKATGTAFLARGAKVVLADLNTTAGAEAVAALEGGAGTVRFVEADVTSESSLAALRADIEAREGPADVLVNSAGILQNATTTRRMDLAEHDRVWDVNYRGTFLAGRCFGERMVEHRRGWIVNLASINSLHAFPLPAYAPGKAAIKSLTELQAVEYGEYKVRVNAVAPGVTLTENIRARIESGQRDPEVIKGYAALGELIEPEDVANGIVFLCSPEAARITGVTLPIDAGWLISVPYKAFPGDVDG